MSLSNAVKPPGCLSNTNKAIENVTEVTDHMYWVGTDSEKAEKSWSGGNPDFYID